MISTQRSPLPFSLLHRTYMVMRERGEGDICVVEELKRNLRPLWKMELWWLSFGIRRDKRLRTRNVKVTNKVNINVLAVGSDHFRGTMRECLNFTIITVFKDEWKNWGVTSTLKIKLNWKRMRPFKFSRLYY
jgi:hypothetical protein